MAGYESYIPAIYDYGYQIGWTTAYQILIYGPAPTP